MVTDGDIPRLPFRKRLPAADTSSMRRSSRNPEQTLERILEAFATASAEGEFEQAEGWLAVARWVEGHRQDAPLVSAR